MFSYIVSIKSILLIAIKILAGSTIYYPLWVIKRPMNLKIVQWNTTSSSLKTYRKKPTCKNTNRCLYPLLNYVFVHSKFTHELTNVLGSISIYHFVILCRIESRNTFYILAILYCTLVETSKEFRTILLGQRIKVYTDHINLTFKNATTPKLNVWNLCSSFSVSNNPLREQCCTYNVF